MNRLLLLSVLLAGSVIVGCSNAPRHPFLDLEFVREFEITSDDQLAVPEGMVWSISDHGVAAGRVTTSDILLEGRAKIGDLELEGRYWLTFQAAQSQTIWVYGGTKIALGDTRPTLTIKEFRDK